MMYLMFVVFYMGWAGPGVDPGLVEGTISVLCLASKNVCFLLICAWLEAPTTK